MIRGNYLTIKYVNKCKQFFGVNFNDAPFMSFPFVWHFRHRLPVWLAMLQMQSLMRIVLCSHSVRSLSNVVVVASMFFQCFFVCVCSVLHRLRYIVHDIVWIDNFQLILHEILIDWIDCEKHAVYCLSRLFKTSIHELNNELSLERTFRWTKLAQHSQSVNWSEVFTGTALEQHCKGLNSG